MNAQIKKGILEMCILYLLSQEDYYGYPLMQKMKSYFPEVDESTFYAILRRIYKEGWTSIYEGKESNGPSRKYYHLTEQGRERLRADLNDWNLMKNILYELGI